MRTRTLLLFCLALTGPLVRAIVIDGGNGTQQTTDPLNGLPWNYVGTVNGASGVFLGNYGGSAWVLTASHVVGSGSSLGNFTVDGNTYSFIPGSGIVVTNGNSSPTDLTLFRISGGPALSNLTLSSSAPAFGSSVALVGFGVRETGSQLFWNVTGSGGGTVWNSLPDATGANATGYATASAGTERWGLTNTIDPTTLSLAGNYNIGTGLTQSLVTQFGAGLSQAATLDSGGALFFLNGSNWELAGILGAVGLFDNQPANTSVLGQPTWSGSIATYNSVILSDVTAVPEPTTIAAWAGVMVLGFAARRRRG